MGTLTPFEKLITDFVYLGGNAIAWMVYLYVGLRLYLLSQRTRQHPERLIAATFLLWVLSYLFYDLAYAVVLADALVPDFCSYAALITLALGNAAFAFFIRSVFRPAARWATWFVAAIVIGLVAGVAGSAWIGDWEGINPLANPWYWLEYFGSFAPTVWLAAEGFTQYFKARRRLKLGLCEPMACNRFLLWGIAGALWMILEAIVTAGDFVLAFTGQWSVPLGFWIATFEAVPVVFIWFVFFPPAYYCRWVEGSGSTGTGGVLPAN
jgi:hypothetical protein